MSHIWSIITTVVTLSSAALLGLNWARGGLQIWIAPQSAFWGFYDKLVKTVEYVSISRGAFGRGGTLAQVAGVTPPDAATEQRKAEAARL